MRISWLSAVLFCCCTATVAAQSPRFSGVGSRWSDSFVEWDLYAFNPDTAAAQTEEEAAPAEIVVGELKLRWLNIRDDWSEWDFIYEETRGTIRQKWKDDPNQWELRTYAGDIVTMRTAWPGDLKEWRVTDNSMALTLRSRWTNQLDEWLVDDHARGRFYLYTYYQRDPRDWVIEDNLTEDVSPAMKMAFIFLTVFHGSPKM